MRRPCPLIAVVDDEEPVRRALQRLLRSSGMEVQIFAAGRAFLSAVTTEHFDCVILDLHMPDMNGFEVLARLHESHSTLPVVIITGHDSPESLDQTRQNGACAYLRKPVDEKTLLHAIEEAVTGSRTEQ